MGLITNYPVLLSLGHYNEELRLYTQPAAHLLVATLDSETPPTVRCTLSISSPPTFTKASSHGFLQKLIADNLETGARLVAVHPHLRVSRLVCLGKQHGRRLLKRTHYKRAMAQRKILKGRFSRARRAQKWQSQSQVTSKGITEFEWSRLRRIFGLNPIGEQLLFRLRHQALSLFDPTQAQVGCPHGSCVGVAKADLHHVFWSCPAAGELRRLFTHSWRRAGLATTDLELNIFGLSLPAIPTGFASLACELFPFLCGSEADRLTEVVTLAVEACWRLGIVLLFHGIWRWRVAHFDSHNNLDASAHRRALSARLRQGYQTIMYRLPAGLPHLAVERAAQVVTQVLLSPDTRPLPPLAPLGEPRYLLFFDGGSRGNPGPGGSGAAVIQIGSTSVGHTLRWIGSMSYAAKTMTNNMAEYMGLLMGIRACGKRKWHPLHVVGDSKIIIHQQRTRTQPKAKHLRPLYWQIRREVDRLGVCSWHHHLRAFNRTADKLANMAMDSQTSFQTEQINCWSTLKDLDPLSALVTADVDHWVSFNHDESLSGLELGTS